MLSAAPMPCPISRYQSPLTAARSTPAYFPEPQFRLMGAGAVAARDEGGLGRGDLSQGFGNVLAAGNVRRIGLRPDHHEIIVHHVKSLHAKSLGEEFLFRDLVVHEHHVGIAAPADIERLPGADGDDLDADPAAAVKRGSR